MRKWFARAAFIFSFALCMGPRKPTQQSLENLETSVSTLKKQQAAAQTPDQKQDLQRQITGQLDQMERLGDQQPSDPKAQTDLGQSFLRVDEPGRALNRGTLAAQLAPNDPAPRLVQAEAYYKLHRYDEAVGAAKEALKLDPQNKAAQAVLMLAHGQTARNPAAEMLKNGGTGGEQAKLAAAGNAAGGVLSNAGGAGGYQPASAAAGMSANEAAELLKSREALSQAQDKLALGDQAAAIAALGKLIALRPKDARAYALRAKALLVAADKGDRPAAARALADARQAVELAPQSAPGRLLFAQTLEANGAPRAEVEAAYVAAAELDPAFDSYHQAALARWDASGAAPSGPGETAARTAASSSGDPRSGWLWLAAVVVALGGMAAWSAARRAS